MALWKCSAAETNNSAFHGTRLDVEHISQIMNNLVTAAERRFGINRYAIAPQTVFMSHETFTPARGGSAAAEILALRRTFGETTNNIIIANTKGFTGHPMGVGVEDVIAVKILEHGIVPPVPNFKEMDPDLGPLNLSRGGRYPVQYAIHLAAGFGSQIAMTLTRRIPGGLDRVDNKPLYQQWIAAISGYDTSETEVEKRVLRVKSQGNPVRVPAPNRWQPGTGPTVRAAASAAGPAGDTPARMAPPPPRAESIAPTIQPVAPPVVPVAATPVEPAEVEKGPLPEAVRVESEPAAGDPVTARIIALVAEQTGYPPDMLDLDLDLEADLGIDTVKQAETFAAIRQAFDIPRRDDMKLRDYPTMAAVIGFVREMRPDLAAAPVAPAAQPAVEPLEAVTTAAAIAAAVVADDTDSVTDAVLRIVAEQTGYPQDMLDLDLDMEADLGIDTVKQAETFAAIRQAFDIPSRDDMKLRDYPTLGAVIGFVREMRPDLALPEPAQVVEQQTSKPPESASPAHQVIVSTASDAADSITEQVRRIVAEQTGYPQDMLELDLDMEADLGIDTVKQAETFAAIRQAFDIPRRDDMKLRDYPTLGAVIGFVREMRPDLASRPDSEPVAQPSTRATPVTPPITDEEADIVTRKVLQIVAEQTGYPQDMLELDLDMEADLGIDTVKQAETFLAIRQAFDIPRRDDMKLRDYPTLGAVIGFVHEMRPDLGSGDRYEWPKTAARNHPSPNLLPPHAAIALPTG